MFEAQAQNPGIPDPGSWGWKRIKTFGHWTLDFLLRFHPLITVVHEFMNDLLAFQTDKTTQAGFPDVITTHIHAVITTVEQLAAFSLSTDRAHKHVFRQSSLPGLQQGYFEP